MKRTLIIATIIFLFSCSDEQKLELFSPEAFAYSLDSGWELNASVQAKGFLQNENNDKFSAKLSYEIFLVTPQKDTLKHIDSGSIVEENDEEILDLNIEIQTELDSTYLPGKYVIIYNIKDNNSGMRSRISREFELTK